MTLTVSGRRLVLCALGAAVLALHFAMLTLLAPAWVDVDGRAVAVVRTLQVRSVSPAPPVFMFAPEPDRAEPSPDMTPALARAAARGRSMRAQPLAVDGRASAVRADGATSAPEARALASAETGSTPDAAIDVPVYATRLPPPGRWRYRLQRGPASGDAELRWALHADARYELQLEARVAGVVLFDWASQGQIDAAGIAPERFALRRRGRDRQAVNFQRDAGKITFSGPTHELPLLAGAQDRLSWLLQLAAVVAAAPEHFGRGAKLVLFVAGARGDADVWTFVVQGVEVQDETPALKLLREPRRLYDTRAEVWLDPAEHYLPIRVLQTPSGGGAALDLIREREAR